MTPLADSAARWGLGTRLLHWGMAALIVGQAGLGLVMVHIPDLFERFTLTQTHKSWGVVIFGLVLLRLGWRAANRVHPPYPAGMPAWQVRAARAVHRALYALLLVLPISGWVMVSAAPTQDLLGIQNRVFGVWALPDPFVPGVAAVEHAARLVHVTAAVALGIGLAIHIAAALWHQLGLRDGLITRMIVG